MNVLKGMSILIIAAGMVACAQQTKSNAGKTMSFECSGTGHGWDECDSKAAAACGSLGYVVTSRDQGSSDSKNGPSQTTRRLNIACK